MFYPFFFCANEKLLNVSTNTVSFQNTRDKKNKQKKKDVNKQLCTLRMNQPFSSKEASLVPYK